MTARAEAGAVLGAELAMLDLLPAALIAIDARGNYLLYNKYAEALLGGRPRPGEAIGTATFAAAFHPDGRAMTRDEFPLIRALAGELVEGMEFVIKNPEYPDGRWLSARAGPIRDRAGATVGAAVVIADITDRIRARDQLAQTRRMLEHGEKMDAIGRLAGAVAHDFNGLLTVIHGYAHMLEADLVGEARQDVAQIRRAAERATALTRQLLTLSRHGTGAPHHVDVGDVVDGFEAVLRRLVGDRITVAIRRGAVPAVLADPGQLEQVVLNLATNARDAMPGGGTLTIETEAMSLDPDGAALRGLAPGQFVVLSVTDTGNGIDPATQARMFEPFFTTKDAGRGTGLGLAIVHGIVTGAGGAVSVYSELGKGTAFRVFLPAATGEVVTARQDPAPTGPGALPAITVLVVDEDEQIRTLATRILSAAGATAHAAAGAEEAQRVFVAADPPVDVVVIDTAPEDWRGDALVRRLVALSPALRVVPMSGYPSGALRRAGEPPRRLLGKPFTPAELVAAVAAAVVEGEPRSRGAEVASAAAAQALVLVVDDDEVVRRTTRRVLERAGFAVVEAGDGRSAVVALGEHRFDAVVSDLQMPELDGLALLRKVRAVDLDLPVILLTGQPDVATAAAAIEHGAFRYLTKPADNKALERLVRLATRSFALARIRRDAVAASGASAMAAADLTGLEVRFDATLEQLWMAFQPIVDARTGALAGIEVLMRSDEPSLPGPEQVLHAAHRLGRLPELGRRVRRLVAAAAEDAAAGHTLFVNLHPDDLADAELVDAAGALSRHAGRIVLEITERASLKGSAALTERLARLRAMGFRIAVDDIGAGYSGLSSFADLMPEIVKIDMSLVRDVHLNPIKRRTIRSLCELCHDMGVLVVGEGVESPAEVDCLRELGCDLLQGYLIGRPARTIQA